MAAGCPWFRQLAALSPKRNHQRKDPSWPIYVCPNNNIGFRLPKIPLLWVVSKLEIWYPRSQGIPPEVGPSASIASGWPTSWNSPGLVSWILCGAPSLMLQPPFCQNTTSPPFHSETLLENTRPQGPVSPQPHRAGRSAVVKVQCAPSPKTSPGGVMQRHNVHGTYTFYICIHLLLFLNTNVYIYIYTCTVDLAKSVQVFVDRPCSARGIRWVEYARDANALFFLNTARPH